MIYQRGKAKSIIADRTKLKDLVTSSLEIMAEVVASTMGPGGRGVLLERDGQAPIVTKDGASVVKAVGLADAEANVIIEAAKEISINTAKDAGDGTTTALVLANALVKHGHTFLQDNPKSNSQKVVRELQECYSSVIVPYLKDLAVPTKTTEDLRHVAKISANGDMEIANVVVEAVIAAGNDGTVLIEESQGRDTRIETIDGYIITTGLKEHKGMGPLFINDRAQQQVKLDNGYVFLYDGSLNDLKVTAKLQDVLADAAGMYDGTPLVLIAHDFADPVMEKLAKAVKTGVMFVPVRTPRSGLPNGASMFLQDMASYCGAIVHDAGTIDSLVKDDLGFFTSFKMNMYETFVTADSDPAAIEERIVELKAILDSAFSEFDRALLKAAIGKLTGGVATIYVGGMSDFEIREKKARVEDAVEAVRSAIAEGVIPGGAVVHLRLASLIRSHPNRKSSWSILANALHEPFTAIMMNAGEDPVEILAGLNPSSIRELPTLVFDADSRQYVNPFEAGIIEPAKVCRVSVGNAISIATLLMTLGGIICTPRDSGLEAQLELAKQSFNDMMATAEQ